MRESVEKQGNVNSYFVETYAEPSDGNHDTSITRFEGYRGDDTEISEDCRFEQTSSAVSK